jgi:hypothetical protein
MNTFITALVGTGFAGLALLLLAVGVAWREHLQRLAHLRQQRVHGAQSHFALLARTQAVDEQLLAVTAALAQEAAAQLAQPQPLADTTAAIASAAIAPATRGSGYGARRQSDAPRAGSPSGRPRLPRALINAAAAAATPPANSARWEETSPMVLASAPEHFDPTLAVDVPVQPATAAVAKEPGAARSKAPATATAAATAASPALQPETAEAR